jgi:hypothetical protein
MRVAWMPGMQRAVGPRGEVVRPSQPSKSGVECQDSMAVLPLASGIWVPSPNRLRCCLDVFGP